SNRAHPDLHSFPTRRSSDLLAFQVSPELLRLSRRGDFEFDADSVLRFLLISKPKPGSGGSGRADKCQGLLVRRKRDGVVDDVIRSEEHTSELQSRFDLVCRL